MEQEDQDDPWALLPDDVLTAILRRLPPRWLATSRCVCKPWRAVVDARRLLRADELPLSLTGLFIHFSWHKYPEFFAAPPATGPAAALTGNLDFLPEYNRWNSCDIQDHCNGLILIDEFVVNPATGRWNALPPSPRHDEYYEKYIVFDPTVSPHYEVLKLPHLDKTRESDPSVEEYEWPPSPFIIHVFSSKSGRWDARPFVREGDAAGTRSEIEECWGRQRSVYWRGALYMHRESDFVIRISLSSGTYHVIQPPPGIRAKKNKDQNLYLAGSEKGLYFAFLDKSWLQVWVLDDSSCAPTKWTVKHDKNLEPMLSHHRSDSQVHWVLRDINSNLFRSDYTDDRKDYRVNPRLSCCGNDNDPQILGFHPFEEIVFLSAASNTRGLAYHLNSSKLEALGSIYPTHYDTFVELSNEACDFESFPYTACWIQEFPVKE